MAFVRNATQVFAFAEFQDVVDQDGRLFRENESLTEDLVEQGLVKATERLVNKFSSTSWWRDYYMRLDTTTYFRTVSDVPKMDATRIVGRFQTFTDLCVYTALSAYILPTVADFSDEANAERQKMDYYQQQADILFKELIEASDWYDFDGSGAVTSDEREPGRYNPRRIR